MKKIFVDFSNVYMHITLWKNFSSIMERGLLSPNELKRLDIEYFSSADTMPKTEIFKKHLTSPDYMKYSDEYVRYGSIDSPTFKSWFTSVTIDVFHSRYVAFCFRSNAPIVYKEGSYELAHKEKAFINHHNINLNGFHWLAVFTDKLTDELKKEYQNWANNHSTKLLVIDYNSFRELFNPTKKNNLVECIEFIPEVTHDKNV